MLRLMSVLVSANLIACTTFGEDLPARNPEAIQQLNVALSRRNDLRNQWSKVAAADHEYCETQVGECEVQVKDTRSDLILNYGNPLCNAKSTSDEEAECVADELIKLGDPSPATRYFKADIWCLEKLQACVAEHKKKTAEDSRLAQIAQRLRQIESSPQGILWHARVAATSEKVKYIRATLPPEGEGECQELVDNSDCKANVEHLDAELNGELSRPEADYDVKKSTSLYEQLTSTEASCFEPELECLSKSVAKYGETPESRRWLQKNFELLDKRQQLIEKAGEGVAEPCIDSAIANHKADIVKSYQAYVREPVLYFRTQLHRSFIALHKTEIDCLTATPPSTVEKTRPIPNTIVDGDS